MNSTPEIVQLPARPMAAIRMHVSRDEIQTVMGPAVQELYATLARQGIPPAGPWFTHHFRRPTDTFDFEACVPTSAPVTASGRVQPGIWPAMTVARTVYSGAYDGLGNAWGEFLKWLDGQPHKQAEDLWEVYLAGPETGNDAAQWRTELNRPLA